MTKTWSDIVPDKRKGLCQGWLHFMRPDRGPEGRCTYRAKWLIPIDGLKVCGHHSRAYTKREPL